MKHCIQEVFLMDKIIGLFKKIHYKILNLSSNVYVQLIEFYVRIEIIKLK